MLDAIFKMLGDMGFCGRRVVLLKSPRFYCLVEQEEEKGEREKKVTSIFIHSGRKKTFKNGCSYDFCFVLYGYF